MNKQQVLNNLNPRHNDLNNIEYYLRFIDYALTGLFFLITFGNKKKTITFHNASNPIRKIRLILIGKKNKKLLEKYAVKDKGVYDFKGIKIPIIDYETDYKTSLITVYHDVFRIFCEYEDNYGWQIIDKLEPKLPEGTYCYIGKNGETILVKPGDTVIDAGAWIGDFSAYAAKKGARVFAFEPTPETVRLLKKTAELNGNIEVVPLGLSDKKERMFINISTNNSGENALSGSGDLEIGVTTLDEWVEEAKVEKIDFIKADIEGHERYMLLGATKVLQTHQPILSLCTYHLPDDPQVMKEIILKANPKYKIMQRKMKLFAYVPQI